MVLVGVYTTSALVYKRIFLSILGKFGPITYLITKSSTHLLSSYTFKMPPKYDQKRMTHNQCRKNVCFLCLEKGPTAGSLDGLSASRVDFIVHGILPEYESVKDFLPS